MVEIGADVSGLMLMFDNSSLIMHGCRSVVLRISPFLQRSRPQSIPPLDESQPKLEEFG